MRRIGAIAYCIKFECHCIFPTLIFDLELHNGTVNSIRDG